MPPTRPVGEDPGAVPRQIHLETSRFDRGPVGFVHSDHLVTPFPGRLPESRVPLAVRLRSVVCILGRFPALAGVDLDVSHGEVLLLSGPNGAGKTTLLRALAGLVPVHRGEAEVLGVNLREDRRAARRRLALVGHDTACYDDLTVRENLRFAARAAGAASDAADEAMGTLGLTTLAGTVHGRLSAGQRRRLALAVALARRPQLLMLDEPHAGLDAEGREALARIVTAAPAEGRTVMIVSHELDQARAISTREVVIRAGRTEPLAVPVTR